MRRDTILVLISSAGTLILGFGAGCTTDALVNPTERSPQGALASLENPGGVELADIPVADRSEVDLVEEMMMHRAMYARYLRVLATYYSEHGYETKANRARAELRDLQRIRPYRYIDDAEAPMAGRVAPTTNNAEADSLYNEGVTLMKKGGHGVPVFYNEQTINLALGKFKELVSKYPNSDKVDDACFMIAEIHKEYSQELDNSIALQWYQAALDANPSLPYPARFQMAVVYDYRMHQREKALELYQDVLEREQFNKSNVDYSRKRIRELTEEKDASLRLATEPGPASSRRPAPAVSPEPVSASIEASPVPPSAGE